MRKIKIYGWMSWFGTLGCLGFLYFVTLDPLFLIFFSFFGFFSFKTFSKYSNIKRDEMFLLHQNQAFRTGLRTFATVTFCGIFFAEVFLKQYDIACRYSFIIALISLSFAVAILLFAILLEYYERIPHKFDNENED